MPISSQFPTIDPSELSRVLKEELAGRGLEVRKFQEQIAEMGKDAHGRPARGSSYGAVWSYINDPPEQPRPGIVEVMARVLGLRYEYLATGRGPRTEAELGREQEGERYRTEGEAESAWFWDALATTTIGSQQTPFDVRHQFGWLAVRLGVTALEDREDSARALRALESLVVTPHRALYPIQDPETGVQWISTSYLRQVLGAFHGVLDNVDELVPAERYDEYCGEALGQVLGLYQATHFEEDPDEQ